MSQLRKFSCAVFQRDPGEWLYFLVEAPDYDTAFRLVTDRAAFEAFSVDEIVWGETPAWRGAWYEGEVQQLRDRKLPEGVE